MISHLSFNGYYIFKFLKFNMFRNFLFRNFLFGNFLFGNTPKGQQLIAQGNALGELDIVFSPCKGKSVLFHHHFFFNAVALSGRTITYDTQSI